MTTSDPSSERRYWLAVKLRSGELHPLGEEHANLIDAQRAARSRARTFCARADAEEHPGDSDAVAIDLLRRDACSIVVMFAGRTAPVRDVPVRRPGRVMGHLLAHRGQRLGLYARISGYLSLLGLWSPLFLTLVLQRTPIQVPDVLVAALVLSSLVIFVVCLPVLIFLSLWYRQRQSASAAIVMVVGSLPIAFFLYLMTELGHRGMF